MTGFEPCNNQTWAIQFFDKDEIIKIIFFDSSEKIKKYDALKNYYRLVDSKEINEYGKLYDLFSDESIYDRAWDIYTWKQEIIDFFESRFPILDITHCIQSIEIKENKWIVEWSYSWYRVDKETGNIAIAWAFIDLYDFWQDGKIIKRVTKLIVLWKKNREIQLWDLYIPRK